jgi:hypothetical protein
MINSIKIFSDIFPEEVFNLMKISYNGNIAERFLNFFLKLFLNDFGKMNYII